ncbi:hypothetical protein V8C42DRAFT_320765 [Trichoderma barbatum]
MGRPAMSIHLEGDPGGNAIHPISLVALLRVICRIITMVRSCQRQKLSALLGSPSLCPMRRFIDIRCGSETHGSPSYPTTRHASSERFHCLFPVCARASCQGPSLESRNWEMRAILRCLRAQIQQLRKRDSNTKRNKKPRIRIRSLM